MIKRKIDLSVLLGSEIPVICEFWSSSDEHEVGWRGVLEGIDEQYGYLCEGNFYTHCRIYQHPNYWISIVEGDFYLPRGLQIRLLNWEDDEFEPELAEVCRNSLVSLGGDSFCNLRDLRAVQVVAPANGWSYDVFLDAGGRDD